MRLLVVLLITALTSGCTSSWANLVNISNQLVPAVPRGNADRGEDIFRRGKHDAPPCLSCHALTQGGFGLGPVMTGISQRAGTRIPGLTSEAYIRQSILEPKAYIAPGYRPIMFPDYHKYFTEQDIADLVAYLDTL